ncbi:MAG TPA: RNA polymerase sigma factor [Sedimentisphaerales bacterium]|jgi:RNA polymerase sigma-70 factor (ECF subfamily)|nr:RNA polymerase sigma factor [Sedimentisphaerales bacterium]HNU29101.1 RNA polymerase sigma factor [Sedimentisphaerales bacterium]
MVEDRVLVWRLNRGDATALSRVYEKYREDLLRLAGSILSDRTAAEDIVQDVFIRFAGLARTFRLTGSLKGYLATCVANAARNQIVASRRRETAGLDEALGLASDGAPPDAWAIYSERFTRVAQAMAELPVEQREVVTLHLYGDLPFREIAAWQKTSIKTVQSRYRYGLEKLRSLLDGEVEE